VHYLTRIHLRYTCTSSEKPDRGYDCSIDVFLDVSVAAEGGG